LNSITWLEPSAALVLSSFLTFHKKSINQGSSGLDQE
jgi:hypothetical protein